MRSCAPGRRVHQVPSHSGFTSKAIFPPWIRRTPRRSRRRRSLPPRSLRRSSPEPRCAGAGTVAALFALLEIGDTAIPSFPPKGSKAAVSSPRHVVMLGSADEFDDDELWNYVPMTRNPLGARRESDDAYNPAPESGQPPSRKSDEPPQNGSRVNHCTI